MNTQFKLYPRGFFGSVNGDTAEKLVQSMDYSLYVAKRARDTVEMVIVNKAIDKAYHALVRKDANINNLEFRLGVMAEIARAFGTRSFQVWHAAQYQSPNFGDNSRLFIEDCLRYIQTGKRELHPMTWATLLGEESNTDTNEQKLSPMAKQFFGKDTFLPTTDTQDNITNLLVQWVSNPSGFEDLVISAHLLFGVPS